ncbi:MAG: VWA domain-containing protein [Planctomycetota bacterium]|jgi:Ca-activated chloride channel family protein
MAFEHPIALALLPLALLPLAAGARRGARAIRIALPSEALDAARCWRLRLLWLPTALTSAAIAACVIAAAGPHAEARRVVDRRFARNIALVIDTSESMRGTDFELEGAPASRMAAARRFAGEFIEGRKGDRLAIVAFGSRAVTQCPLTFDGALARALLGYVEPEMLGKRTALGEGIALGVARLPRGGALVLISDGENTAGAVAPADAARLAAARGVKIYAIGVGSEGPVPVPARLPSGRVRMQWKRYALDEDALRRVADLSGGSYFRASDARSLRDVFAEIDALERKEAGFVRALPRGRITRWTGAFATAALTCLLLLSATALRTAPRLR